MTLRQLQAFVHVMRLGAIVATAEAMGLTQSGVSRMISELERGVGFKLFVRSGRGLKPTSEGLRFFKEVERSVTEMEGLRRVAEEIRLGFGQRLRVSVLPTMSATVLPLALRRFHETFPNTAVEVDTATYDSALIALEEDRIDLAVTFHIPGMDGIDIEWLAEADYVFAAPRDHPLMEKERVRAGDLVEERLIGDMAGRIQDVQESDDLRRSLEAPTRRRIWCHTSATRYAMIAGGLATSLAEPFSAPLWSHAGVAIRPFEPRLSIRYCFAVPSTEQRSQESVAFRRAFRAAIAAFAAEHDLPIRTDPAG
ncbi:LysR family transcriptional regulator [Roseovarius ramblicola]|uniref:LysR family transcriptional regulator n=1 Tax=Roseovarius ramblicola TaxID=2022336 RepID=A0ABV5I1A4_9RHOB